MTTLSQEYFPRVLEATEKAVATAHERAIGISGQTIRFRFTTAEIAAKMSRAFAHVLHNTPPAESDWLVSVWDRESTGVLMPPLSWLPEKAFAAGDVRYISDSAVQLSYDQGSGTLSILNTNQRRAVYWASSLNSLPDYEFASPFRTILHWALRTRGTQLAHAAAVGTNNGAVLLAGKGGSGKSTTALFGMLGGLLLVSDDFVALRSDPPRVYSVYCSAKIPAAQLHRCPELGEKPANSEKITLFLQDRFEGQLAQKLPVHAILLPTLAHSRHSQIEPASSAVALRELSASTVFQLPGSGADDFANLSRFVQRIPSYVLRLGEDPRDATQLIDDLLRA